MQHHRRRIVTTVLVVLASGMLALRAARTERTPEFVTAADWQPDVWYRLDDHSPITFCELPAGRYRLVVGCLGDAAQERIARISLMDTPPNLRGDDRRGFKAEKLARRTSERTKETNDLSPTLTCRTSFEIAFEQDQSVGTTRDFFLHVTDGELDDPKQYARISARCVTCGNRVRVFVDQQLAEGEMPRSRVDELVRMLETEILPRVESQFGSLRDVDGDGRLAVVLTPWLSRLQGGRTSIGGMVRSSDFQLDVSPPLGNRSDMLFLNSSLPNGAALRDLLSHEVAHAACISQRLSGSGRVFRDEDDWLSEALAHLAEPGWSNLDHRLAAFLDDTSRYPLVVPDYYRAGLWRNAGCRGATFLFTRWCVERHGPNLVRQLVQSTERGTRNLECATGRRFEDLFREWSLALAADDELAAPDLRSALKRLGSKGLQRTICNAKSHEQTLRIRGTAFAVVELLVDESSPRMLRLVGDPAVKWQFSIGRISEDSHGHAENSTLAANAR